MAFGECGRGRPQLSRRGRVLLALSATLMMGACAQLGEAPTASLAQDNHPASERGADGGPKSELDKAIAYWGEQYAKSPRDKKAAISYARNLKAGGQKERALTVLQQASLYHNDDRELASEYGRLALEFGQISLAQKLLAFADDPNKPDWRLISAQGTVLAKQGDYKGAIPYFERALKLAPDQPSVMNNLAMALAAEGQPHRAEPMLRQAAATAGADAKVTKNLVLVLGLQGKHDEATRVAQATGEAGGNAAADVAYLRQMVKAAPASSQGTVATPAPVLRPGTHTDDGAPIGDWTTRVATVRDTPALRQSQR